MENKYTYKLKSQDKNKLEFEIKASKEAFNEIYEEMFKDEAKKVKIAGFRPGMAPRAEIEKRIASDVINKAVNTLLPKISYEILIKEDINPISNVKYNLEKINEDSSIDFEITVVDSPKIDTTKLTKIKVEKEKSEIKDEEVDMVIKNVIQSTLPESEWKKEDGKDFEVTDEMVAKLGYEEEKTLDGLKSKVRETLERVKEEESENQYASKVLKEAVKLADFFIPEDLIEDEVHHKEHHFIERLENLKLDVDSYLKTQNKTLEQLREEWKTEITENAGIDILTINLAKQEKLIPTDEELEEEIEKIEDQVTKIRYKSDERLRDQMRTVLTRNRGVKKIVDLTRGK